MLALSLPHELLVNLAHLRLVVLISDLLGRLEVLLVLQGAGESEGAKRRHIGLLEQNCLCGATAQDFRL